MAKRLANIFTHASRQTHFRPISPAIPCREIHVLSDPENRGSSQRGVNFDTLGTWNNRMQLDIMIDESIRQGVPVPKISMESVGAASLTGRREHNEDRVVCRQLAAQDADLLYFAVFDGHGGSYAAEYASRNMENHITYWWNTGARNLELILEKSFVALNNAFSREIVIRRLGKEEGFNSGTTCTVCLIRNSVELAVGHVGDSRALLCRKGSARRLTTDHTPENKQEYRRIVANGGHVSTNSVGMLLVNGRLAMTRSIGDTELKCFGVTPVPDTASLKVKHGQDAFLVLTTDGVNFVLTDDEICSSVSRCADPAEAATFIADQALQYGSDDNATALVIPFASWGKYSSPLTNLRNSGLIRWSSRQNYS